MGSLDRRHAPLEACGLACRELDRLPLCVYKPPHYLLKITTLLHLFRSLQKLPDVELLSTLQGGLYSRRGSRPGSYRFAEARRELAGLRQPTEPTKIGQRIARNLKPEGEDIHRVELARLVTDAHLPQEIPARSSLLACATPRPVAGRVESQGETEEKAGLLFCAYPTTLQTPYA